MSIPSTSTSALTSGLLSSSPLSAGTSVSILTGGITADPSPLVPILNANEALPAPVPVYPTTDVLATQAAAPIVRQAPPAPIVSQAAPSTAVTDPTTLTSALNPVTFNSTPSSLTRTQLPGDITLFTGSDIRLMVEVADPLGPIRWAKQLVECSTITISVHRVKDPARSCGFIGARGYSRGGRTIAGTMVLTELGKDALFEFLAAFALRDKSKDSTIVKVDQIPPLNISLLFTNEAGYASSRRLLGVDMVTDGTVYSVNDAYSERTISYVAADFTPLMPTTIQALQNPPSASSTGSTLRETSPIDLMQSPVSSTLIPLVSYT